MIVDLCAGPGGWDTGARLAGYTGPIVGIELDHAACRTGMAAGHHRIRADIATYPAHVFRGRVDGLIGSPPCTGMSPAGEGVGRLDIPNVCRLVDDHAAGRPAGCYTWHDERSPLSAEPMRWAVAIRPPWIALEQVPPVLPIWRHTAARLRELGYRTWVGILSAEEYGVPQTRKRAVLIAALDRPIGPPRPTHQRWRPGRPADEHPDLFGAVLPPPVTMAQALGWTGATMHKVRGAGMVERHGARPGRPMDAPAPTVLSGGRKGGIREEWRFQTNATQNATVRDLDEPAPTIVASRSGNMRWLPAGDTDDVHMWPAGTAGSYWTPERPATTVQGDPRIWPPGHKVNGDDRRRDALADERYGDRAGTGAVRVSIEEAALLQSFPPDYPWQGNRTARYRQVGDAVPPLLAAAVLRPLVAAVDDVPARPGCGSPLCPDCGSGRP